MKLVAVESSFQSDNGAFPSVSSNWSEAPASLESDGVTSSHRTHLLNGATTERLGGMIFYVVLFYVVLLTTPTGLRAMPSLGHGGGQLSDRVNRVLNIFVGSEYTRAEAKRAACLRGAENLMNEWSTVKTSSALNIK